MKIAVISDAQPVIGCPPGLHAERVAILNHIELNYDMLVVNGDAVSDLMLYPWEKHRIDVHYRMLMERIRVFAKPVHIVAGNHDPMDGHPSWPKVRELLAGPQVAFHPVAFEFSGVRFEHGHRAEWDFTTALWDSLLNAARTVLGETLGLRMARWLIGRVMNKRLPTPYELKSEAWKFGGNLLECWDKYDAMVAVLHHAHWAWLNRQGGVRSLVCGHTHYDEVRQHTVWSHESRWYVNAGALDGQGQCTFAVLTTDGNRLDSAELVRWGPVREPGAGGAK